MKRYKLSLILLSLLVLTSLMGIFSMNGFTQSTDLNYIFQNDILYESNQPLINKTFNIGNASEFTEHYNATYSFENDIIGGNPNGWIIDENVNIGDEIDGHEKIAIIWAKVADDFASMRNTFISQVSGTIELWYRTENLTDYNYIELKPFGVRTYRPGGSVFRYLNTTADWNTFWTGIEINIWYHIKIDFDCNTDTYNWTVNGILTGNNLPFSVPQDSITELKLMAYSDDEDRYACYFDAIGYSWEDASTKGTNFDVSGDLSQPVGMTNDGIYFWIISLNDNKIYKYTNLGVYTGFSFEAFPNPEGIAWDGNYYWVCTDDEVYQYTSLGVYTGIHFDTENEDLSMGDIAWDGNFFWLLGFVNNEMYQYNASGVYTGIHFDTDLHPTGMGYDDGHFWIVSLDFDIVKQYNYSGSYTGISFDVNAQDIFPYGIAFYDDYVWVLGYDNERVFSNRYKEHYYDVGDNVNPYLNVSDIAVVDRYEFALSDIDTWYDNLDENPSGFDTYVVGSGDSHIVKIVNENRWVYSRCDGLSSQAGIKKEDFNFHGEFVNITVKIRYTERVDESGFGLIRIYSYDNTEILQLRLDDEGNLEYYNGSEYILLYAGEVGAYEDHEFYAFINYELDLAFLTHYIDGAFFNYSIFPLIATDKEGLKAVDVGLYTITNNNFIQFVEYIGVYVNGTSQADEFGYIAFDLETLEGFDGDWLFIRNNLFSITAKGFFTIGVSAGKGYFEDYFYSTLIDAMQYNNVETLYNLYFVEQETSYPQPFIIIYLEQDNSFENLTLLNIEGVNLTEGSNEYLIDFTYGNVDIDESYFYVDDSNNLRGICHYNDSDLEYIQANFDIENVLNENRSIRFRSSFSGQYGFFSLSYIDATSSTISLPIRFISHNVQLPQAKTVDEFVFLITDDDDLEAGYGSGYITDIELTWNPSISISILTISLIMIIIPIIIIIVPTLTLYSRFGKSVIMPVFIFMCVICFAGGLLPAWLFFILMIGSGGFLVLRKGDDD